MTNLETFRALRQLKKSKAFDREVVSKYLCAYATRHSIELVGDRLTFEGCSTRLSDIVGLVENDDFLWILIRNGKLYGFGRESSHLIQTFIYSNRVDLMSRAKQMFYRFIIWLMTLF